MDDLLRINANLSKRLGQHLSAINTDITPMQVAALWQQMAIRYSEPLRAYHNLSHLAQLFSQFEQVKSHLNEPHIIALALYFHDVIYDPSATDNERQSAEYAAEKLSAYLSATQCQRIYNLIMMTADHQLSDAKDTDGAFLLDMDLSILGVACSAYDQYAQAIRQEYAHISNEDYQVGRTTVLTGLLAHPRLYLTDYYHQRLQTQARENMQREISLLLAA